MQKGVGYLERYIGAREVDFSAIFGVRERVVNRLYFLGVLLEEAVEFIQRSFSGRGSLRCEEPMEVMKGHRWDHFDKLTRRFSISSMWHADGQRRHQIYRCS